MASQPKKVALVTGAARGIGLATATRFLEDGWRVAMLDVLGDTLRSAADGLSRAEATLALGPAWRISANSRRAQSKPAVLRQSAV